MMRNFLIVLVLLHQFATVHGQFPGDVWSISAEKCLTMMEGDLVISTCVAGDNAQAFVFDPVDGSSNYYLIKPENSNLCLRMEVGQELNDGAKVVEASCPSTSDENFEFKVSGHYGQRYIVNKNSFKCLTTDGSSNGDSIIQTDCANLEEQRFDVSAELAPIDGAPNIGHPGTIQSLHTSGAMCLFLESFDHQDNLFLHPCDENEWQQEFIFILAPDGVNYWIQSDKSDLCVAARKQNGETNVRQNTCFNKAFILWEARPKGAGYQLYNHLYDECMVAGGEHNDTNVVLEECDTSGTADEFQIWAELPGNNDDDILASPPAASPNQQPTTPNPTAAPHLNIRWSDKVELDQTPASAANLPNGEIMTWSSYTKLQFGKFKGQTWVGLVDPDLPTYNAAARSTLVQTNHDMFCPGTAILPDGRLMVSGGSRGEALTFYRPEMDLWVRGADMNIHRGYHSMTTLGDGRVLTMGGSWIDGRADATGFKFGEIWDPISNDWSLKTDLEAELMLTNDKDGIYRQDNHFWMFQAPDGKVFHAGPSAQAHWIDVTEGSETITDSTVIRRNPAGQPIDTMVGVALMFDIGKILTLGGAPDYRGGFSVPHSHVIDLGTGEGTESVTRVGDMAFTRCNTNAVVLPNGHVVVIGGQDRSRLFTDLASRLHAEIWDPETGQWTLLNPPMETPRNYHSVALLMMDGRIFSGGGGLCGDTCGDANHPDYHILTPPYLLNSDGSDATRPNILFATQRIGVNDAVLDVLMDTSEDHTFALCRLGAITHSTNTDSRRIPLVGTFIPNPGVTDQFTFQLALPLSRNILIPGQYYLFAMNFDGVPSIGRHIIVDGAAGGLEPPTTDTIVAEKQPGDPCVAPQGNHTIGEFEMGLDTCVERLAEQYYTFEEVPGQSSYYRVRVGSTGRCSSVDGASTTSGALVIQSLCNDNDEQLWQVSGTGNNQQMENKNSGLCLAVQGTDIVQSSCNPVGNANSFRISSEL